MKVLMITGDRRIFEPGTEAKARFKLQQSAVEELRAVFWGKGALIRPFFTNGKFDVVTSQDPFWRGLVAWCIARRLGAQLNIQVHTDFEAETKSKPIRHLLGQIVLRHADSVRVVSERIKDQVRRHTQAPISVLPIFFDIEKFRNLVHRPHPRKTILWMGRFEDEKDPLLAITVLEKVLQAGIDAELTVLGKGNLEEKFSKGAANLPISWKYGAQIVPISAPIKNLGWQQDTAPYLEVADVFLCTSKYESWGASIVEALAAGVPVVAPDVGVAKEAGAIIASRDRLAEAVIEVLRSVRPVRGELKLSPLSKEEWTVAWKETL